LFAAPARPDSDAPRLRQSLAAPALLGP